MITYRRTEKDTNECDTSGNPSFYSRGRAPGMVENHLTRSSRDAWRGPGLVEKRAHHDHETQGDAQVLGYKRQARRSLRVISVEGWSVKPLNLLLCLRDANDVE